MSATNARDAGAEVTSGPAPAPARTTSRPAQGLDKSHPGATVWITGLPAAGKSTLACAVAQQLVAAGRPVYRVDGDELRTGLCSDLGFDEASRVENVRRAAEVARILAEAGIVALVSLISPYRAGRQEARERHEAMGLPFLEVWVATPLSECERRDPKGLYRGARSGKVDRMTGIDDPYEPPSEPDLVVTPDLDVAQAAELVVELIVAAPAGSSGRAPATT